MFQGDAGDAEFPRERGLDLVHSGGDHENSAGIAGGVRGGDEAGTGVVLQIVVEQDDIDAGTRQHFQGFARRAALGYDFEIRAFCKQQRIIYQSFWTLTANPHLVAHPAITALASQYERTSEQILFRYLTQRAIVPLTGTRSETHMREDLAIFEFELTERECAAIDAAF